MSGNSGTTEQMYQRINDILDSIENEQLQPSQPQNPPPPPQPSNVYPSQAPPPQQAPPPSSNQPPPPEWLMSGIQHQQKNPEDYSRFNPKDMMDSDEIGKIVDDIKTERLLKEKKQKRELEYEDRRTQLSKASIISVVISSVAGLVVFFNKIKSFMDNKRIQNEQTPSF